MLESLPVKQLIETGCNLTYLDKKAATTIQQAIVNCFVLPWPNISNVEQEFERRAFMLQEYIANLAQDILNIDNSVGLDQHDRIDKVSSVVDVFILLHSISILCR